MALQGLQECGQRRTVILRLSLERVSRGLSFAAMPEDCFFKGPRTTVVQERSFAENIFGQSDPPERCGEPFASGGIEVGSMIG